MKRAKFNEKSTSMKSGQQFTFLWWNLHDLAHHDPTRTVLDRRPKHLSDYELKRDRTFEVIRAISHGEFPDLIAVCEITRDAAVDFVGRLPPGFDLAIAPSHPKEDDFQVAIFYRSGVGITPELPLLPSETEDVTRETRPMVVVHLTISGHVVRFVACHWTSLDLQTSKRARKRLADFFTSRYICISQPRGARSAKATTYHHSRRLERRADSGTLQG